MQLPASVADLQSMVHTVNVSVSTALAEVDRFEKFAVELADSLLDSTRQALDGVDRRVDDVDSVLEVLDAALGNVTAAAGQLHHVADSIPAASIERTCTDLQATLNSSALALNASVAADLSRLGSGVTATAQLLDRAVDGIQAWAQGRCVGGGSVAAGTRCSDDSQCGGTACVFAVRRCAAAFAVQCPTGSDEPCPAGTHCLLQAQLYRNTSAALHGLVDAVAELPDTSPAQHALAELVQELQSLQDLHELDDQVHRLLASCHANVLPH